MSGAPKILLATLWQRTSERGNEYLSGFLGNARIVAFRGEPTPEGVPTWNVYVTPGREQQEARPARTPRPRASAPQHRPATDDQAAADGEPLNDDISDVGRGEV